VGAAIQLFTGTILVGLAYMGDEAPDNLKITIKTLLATGALIAAILGAKRQKHGESKLQPFFHTAGGFAVINLVIAVLWNAELYVSVAKATKEFGQQHRTFVGTNTADNFANSCGKRPCSQNIRDASATRFVVPRTEDNF